MASENQDDPTPKEGKSASRFSGPGLVLPLMFLAIIAGYLLLATLGPKRTDISYRFFLDQLKAQNVKQVSLLSRTALGEFKDPPLLQLPAATESSPEPSEPAPAETKAPPAKTEKPPRRAEKLFTVSLPERASESGLMETLDKS